MRHNILETIFQWSLAVLIAIGFWHVACRVIDAVRLPGNPFNLIGQFLSGSL